MTIFIIVGMPAAGKNIARLYAEKNNYPYFATGDLVRDEVKKRNLPADAVNTAKISDELRGADGLGVTQIALARALKEPGEIVFLEGIRSLPEVEMIKNKAQCFIIAFVAPRTVRLSRVIQRGRADDSAAVFDTRDRREINYGVAACIALADEYILNTASMEKASEQLEDITKRQLAG